MEELNIGFKNGMPDKRLVRISRANRKEMYKARFMALSMLVFAGVMLTLAALTSSAFTMSFCLTIAGVAAVFALLDFTLLSDARGRRRNLQAIYKEVRNKRA